MFDAGGKADDFIEDPMGDFTLAELRKRQIAAVARKDGHDVGVRIEAGAFGRDIVGDNEVGVFVFEFFAGVFGDTISFGGKAYDQTITFVASDSSKDVVIRNELQRDSLFP